MLISLFLSLVIWLMIKKVTFHAETNPSNCSVQASGCSFQQLITTKTYLCDVGSNYDQFSSDDLGISHQQYLNVTMGYWFKLDKEPAANTTWILSTLRLNSATSSSIDRLKVLYTPESKSGSMISLLHAFDNGKVNSSYQIQLGVNKWYFVFQMINYEQNTYLFNFFDPSQTQNGYTDDGELIFDADNLASSAGDPEAINADVLFVNGATGLQSVCATYSNFFFFGGRDLSFGIKGILRYGLQPTVIDVLPATNAQGQFANSVFSNLLTFQLGHTSAVETQDLPWSADNVISGLNLQGVVGQFVKLLGTFSLTDSSGDVNFGISFAFQPTDVGKYPKSVMTKGTFILSYDNQARFSVSFGGVTRALYTYFEFGSWNYITLLCTSKYRANIYCIIGVNHTTFADTVFPSSVNFTDTSSLIIPSSNTEPMIGRLMNFIFSRDRIPVYDTVCQDSCFLSNDAGCLLYSSSSVLDSTCSDGSFANPMQSFCSPCDSSCLQCTGTPSYSCSACKSPYVEVEGTCVCTSPSSYTDSNGTCKTCDASCSTCSGAGPQNCTTCASGLYYDYNRQLCVPSCQQRYFPNDLAMTCDDCPDNCDVCIDSSSCLTCSNSFYLYNGTCLARCPNGTYPQPGVCVECLSTGCPCSLGYAVNKQEICESCSANCQMCADSNICEVCNENLIVNQGKCSQSLQIQNEVKNSSAKLLSRLAVINPEQSSVAQNLTVWLSTMASGYLYWYALAYHIHPDSENTSCAALEAQFGKASADLEGVELYGRIDLGSSNSLVINFTISQLISNTNYQVLLCAADYNESLTVRFTTKNNGFQVSGLKLLLDQEIYSNDIQGFLCQLCLELSVDNSQIMTKAGQYCPSSGDQTLESQNSTYQANNSFNPLELFLYGDRSAENDTSVAMMEKTFQNDYFLNSFMYVGSNATRVYQINEVFALGETDMIQPVILTPPQVSLSGTNLFVSNLSIGAVNGFVYATLLTTSNETHPISSNSSDTLILNYSSLALDPYYRRLSYKEEESLAFMFNEIDPSKNYTLLYFATNSEVSKFALRTPLLSLFINAQVPEKRTSVFIVIEFAAGMFLGIAWLASFRESYLKKLFGRVKTTLKFRKKPVVVQQTEEIEIVPTTARIIDCGEKNHELRSSGSIGSEAPEKNGQTETRPPSADTQDNENTPVADRQPDS